MTKKVTKIEEKKTAKTKYKKILQKAIIMQNTVQVQENVILAVRACVLTECETSRIP